MGVGQRVQVHVGVVFGDSPGEPVDETREWARLSSLAFRELGAGPTGAGPAPVVVGKIEEAWRYGLLAFRLCS